MYNYKVDSLLKLNNFLRRNGLSAIKDSIKTTSEVIDELDKRGEIEDFVKSLILFELHNQFDKNHDTLINNIIKHKKHLAKSTHLKLPITVPVKGSLILLILSFLITYLFLFYLLFFRTSVTLPIFLMLNVGVGSIIALFLWKGLLYVFSGSIGQEEFINIKTDNDLMSEMYILNKEIFFRNQYKILNEKIYLISIN